MLNSTYEHYLECLRPYSCDSSLKLTAPSRLLNKLSEIAEVKETNRLDLIRHALAEYIHNHEDLYA